MEGVGRETGCKARILRHLAHAHHRSAYLLSANPIVNALTGIAFWWLVTRALDVPAEEVGLGYAIISLGTILGVIAKGGLDTALIRHVPQTSARGGLFLLALGAGLGAVVAGAGGAALGAAAHTVGVLPDLSAAGWTLVAGLGILLVVTWLQDAWCVAEERPEATVRRNTVFGVCRLVLPLPLLLLSAPYPVAGAWAAALAASALVALASLRSRPRPGRPVGARTFLRSAQRNMTGSAAEFLPGLLLAPIVLAVSGAAAAAYFGIAWTGATLLFLVSAAIGRSTLAALVRESGEDTPLVLRRGARLMMYLVAPAAIIGILFAPFFLGLFGADYAREGAQVFALLCLSAFLIAPAYLYLAYLRATESPRALFVFPASMVLAVLLLTPLFTMQWGILGAGLAWLVANAPFGVYGALRLHHHAREGEHVLPRELPVAVPPSD